MWMRLSSRKGHKSGKRLTSSWKSRGTMNSSRARSSCHSNIVKVTLAVTVGNTGISEKKNDLFLDTNVTLSLLRKEGRKACLYLANLAQNSPVV